MRRGDKIDWDGRQVLVQDVFLNVDGRWAVCVVLPGGLKKILLEGDDFGGGL